MGRAKRAQPSPKRTPEPMASRQTTAGDVLQPEKAGKIVAREARVAVLQRLQEGDQRVAVGK